jgi:hypothetical protein
VEDGYTAEGTVDGGAVSRDRSVTEGTVGDGAVSRARSVAGPAALGLEPQPPPHELPAARGARQAEPQDIADIYLSVVAYGHALDGDARVASTSSVAVSEAKAAAGGEQSEAAATSGPPSAHTPAVERDAER